MNLLSRIDQSSIMEEGNEETPNGATDRSDDDPTGVVQQHSVSHASYPIPQPLSRILQASMSLSHIDDDDESNHQKVVETEDTATALGELLENALQSIDALYFSAPPKVRALPEWKHRTCLRISASSQHKTITICDLGVGMTRADLINMLGVGRPLNSASASGSGATGKKASSSEESEESDGDEENQVVSCKKTVLGGFYSALCALGVGVRVGTKVCMHSSQSCPSLPYSSDYQCIMIL